jgi:uncharacterized membrane protein YjjP (DUF1212 family)
MTSPDFSAHMAFVVALARRLHQYGTSAPRLEEAIDSVSARLGLSCQSLSTPTSILFSFTAAREGGLAELTQVVRVAPGQDDLRNLCAVNEIADRVIDGEIGVDEGFRLLGQISDRMTPLRRVLEVFSYGIAAATVAAILHSSAMDVVAAAGIGTVVGILALSCDRRPRLRPALEAICALFATLAATLVSVYATPLNLRAVVLASVIVLLPGLTLTTAVRELSTQHLVSGVARFAGAVTTLIKLAFGAVVANQLCHLLRLAPPLPVPAPVPAAAEWLALALGSFAFAILFRAARRDIPTVMAAAALGYLITFYGGRQFTPEFGVFLAGLSVGALANLYSRHVGKPGAVIRAPGIVLLVPGSVGFLSLSLLVQGDIYPGINLAVSLVSILACLVAGLLFGDILVAPRRSL